MEVRPARLQPLQSQQRPAPAGRSPRPSGSRGGGHWSRSPGGRSGAPSPGRTVAVRCWRPALGARGAWSRNPAPSCAFARVCGRRRLARPRGALRLRRPPAGRGLQPCGKVEWRACAVLRAPAAAGTGVPTRPWGPSPVAGARCLRQRNVVGRTTQSEQGSPPRLFRGALGSLHRERESPHCLVRGQNHAASARSVSFCEENLPTGGPPEAATRPRLPRAGGRGGSSCSDPAALSRKAPAADARSRRLSVFPCVLIAGQAGILVSTACSCLRGAWGPLGSRRPWPARPLHARCSGAPRCPVDTGLCPGCWP